MSSAAVLVLLGAGVLAAALGTAGGITSLVSYPALLALGTAGGITSLVSYPALLAVGVPALEADVVNLVAVVACWPGSAWASRRELVGAGRWLRLGLPVAAAGGVAGSVLLLFTPRGVFAGVVPFLVALGAVALLASPALIARRGSSAGRTGGAGAFVGVGLLSVYGGYFGAGAGVMLLTLALVLLDPRLPRANAIKNMLVGATGLASAVVLVLAGPVVWTAVLPLAAGMLAGATVGPVLARHLPERLVRGVVAALGLLLALDLWLHPG